MNVRIVGFDWERDVSLDGEPAQGDIIWLEFGVTKSSYIVTEKHWGIEGNLSVHVSIWSELPRP